MSSLLQGKLSPQITSSLNYLMSKNPFQDVSVFETFSWGLESIGLDNVTQPKRSCIVCVGTTGTGKSTTIKTMTGQNLQTGSGAESITQDCQMYKSSTTFVKDMKKIQGLYHSAIDKATGSSNNNTADDPADWYWIDTPGWSDSNPEIGDYDTFRNILQFMSNNSKTSVKAIIWCITSSERCTNLLNRQAALINRFMGLDDKINIWTNVIIICKSARSSDPEALYFDCQGAIEAAKKHGSYCDIMQVGYTVKDSELMQLQMKRILEHHTRGGHDDERDDETGDWVIVTTGISDCSKDRCPSMYNNMKMQFNMKEKSEIQVILTSKLLNLIPVPVVARNKKCNACGDINDSRLMSQFCHFEKQRGHTQKLNRFHAEKPKNYHKGTLAGFHPLGFVTSGSFLFWRSKHTHGCCPRWAWQDEIAGCREQWDCCKQERIKGNEECTAADNIWYPCCQRMHHSLDPIKRHPGQVHVNNFTALGLMMRLETYTCCEKPKESDGCQDFFSCCERFDNYKMGCEPLNTIFSHEDGCRTQYPCCRGDATSLGCGEVCKKCGVEWGLPSDNCTKLSDENPDHKEIIEFIS